MRADPHAGAFDPESILTALERWMRQDVGHGRPSPLTLASYRSDTKQHLLWLAERELTPAGVTAAVLEEYRAHLAGQYKASTVGRKVASVRRFYQLAHAHGMLKINPAQALKAPASRGAPAKRVKYLSLVTLKALLAATDAARAPEAAVRDKAILALMSIHGLRVCEVSRLDVDDVHLAAGEAGEAGELRVLGKGGKRRKVYLTRETSLCIERWLAVRRLLRPPTAALFVALSGPAERISTRGLRGMVDRYLLRVGSKREGVSCHALRHTYAAQSLAAGASLLAVSGSLGHASVTPTQVYAQLVEHALSNPAAFLKGVL